MELEIISAELKEKLQRHNGNTLAMYPWETADFLLKCGETLLKYVQFSNNQIGPNSEALLSASNNFNVSCCRVTIF